MENSFESSTPGIPNLVSEDKQKEVIKKFEFHGTSSELFRIFIVNALLTVVTLGLYYPWAKAKILQYNYGESEFMGSRFIFHGTGKEIFRGFIKSVIILGSLYGILLYTQKQGFEAAFWGVIIFYVGIFLVMPMIIVGTLRYRASRSSWRGIYFQYVGTVTSMYKVVGLGVLYSILTLGIYWPWLKVDVYKEVAANLRLGNIRFKFTGEGSFYFLQYLYAVLVFIGLAFVAGIIIAISASSGGMNGLQRGSMPPIFFVAIFIVYGGLFLYVMKVQSNIFNYTLSNWRMHQDAYNLKGTLKAETTGMDFFSLYFVNLLIIVFSLGLATPVAIVRTLNFYAKQITIRGNVDFNMIEQKEIDMSPGSGAEGFFDSFDMDLQII